MKMRFVCLVSLLALLWGCTETEQSETKKNAHVERSITVGTQPHAVHSKELGHHGPQSEAFYDSLHKIKHAPPGPSPKELDPRYKTFGWHPYYAGSAYKSYDFNMLWGIAYFSYGLNPETGGYTSVHNWYTTEMVDSAQKYGTKVFLAVNNFGASKNHTFLSAPDRWTVLGDSLIHLLEARNAAGVNLDFEEVSSEDGEAFTQFLVGLSKQLKAHNPAWLVTLALYAVDNGKVFDFSTINPHIDLYTMMGYDYYYSGSKEAGPVAPLNAADGLGGLNLEKSVETYLSAGAPKEKFILGLPYYGRQWTVSSEKLPSPTTGYVNSPGNGTVVREYNMKEFLAQDQLASNYHSYEKDGKMHQIWIGAPASLGLKYDFAKEKGLAGIAIWSLGMDNGIDEYWNLMREKFGTVPE